MRTDSRHDPVCIKFHALSRWTARQLGDIAHERRVAAIASSLFDLTSSLHGLSGADRRLLRMAAIVHDVGRSIDEETHPQHGARMVREQRDLPLSGGERRWLAYLTRYHRGRVPAVRSDSILRGRDDHGRLRTLLALLRAADGLDSRAAETPRLRFSLEGRRLRIDCQLEQNTPKARRVYTRRKKFRLLEQVLGCRVQVSVTRARPMRLVA
ncbi:MAG TPA: HD domain-containing protein [Tepidisphaeraceae bacterium]|jgi:exopolyphosphatase/guanosine-5'-triphosphate,3'-diphosphate pyrophosphatase|nr:HD domain-containing protein [Tepidisphaeraceae bacterium]